MRSVSITRVCGLLVMFMIAVGVVKGELATAAPSLTVSVQTEQKSVKNGGFLLVVTNIQNVGDTIQTLRIWSCSHERNWKTDNLFVRVMHGSCKKDAIQNVKLEAGETYKHTLHLGINVPDREASINSLSFRLGFIDGNEDIEKQLSTWSNVITINITEQ
jgi:hypothetical protein